MKWTSHRMFVARHAELAALEKANSFPFLHDHFLSFLQAPRLLIGWKCWRAIACTKKAIVQTANRSITEWRPAMAFRSLIGFKFKMMTCVSSAVLSITLGSSQAHAARAVFTSTNEVSGNAVVMYERASNGRLTLVN